MVYILRVSEEDLGVIAEGLDELPRKRSQPVIVRLAAQAQRQRERQVTRQGGTSAARSKR